MTPLQMAMVAGAIGNAGILMRPWVVDRIVSPKGKTVEDEARADRARRRADDGARRRGDDGARRPGGTGTAAQISGYRVGGKTGTAETGVAGRNTTWFIAFAGREGERPELAIAVVLENQTLNRRATAAPIARQVMEALLLPRRIPNVTRTR